MPYCAPDDVRQALAPQPVSNGTKTGTAADLADDQLKDAIAEADAQIDSCIGRYYATPVAAVAGTVPVPIRWWSRNIAAYNATLTWRKGKDLSTQDPVYLRWKATTDQLYAVRDGKQTLELPRDDTVTAATGASTPFNPYIGNFWDGSDLSLAGPNDAWPFQPDLPNELGRPW